MDSEHLTPSIFVLADRHGQIDESWLGKLHEMFPASRVIARSRVARMHGLTGADCSIHSPASIIESLDQDFLTDGLLIVRNGLVLPRFFLQRLENMVRRGDLPTITFFPGNYDQRANPLSGLEVETDREVIDSQVANLAHLQWTAVGEVSFDCCFIAPGVKSFKDHRSRGSVVQSLVDDMYIIDPEKSLTYGRQFSPAHQTALGHLRIGLNALAEQQVGKLPFIGIDGKPVTLHISHSWGGGVSRWIADQCQHDKSRHHLILASSGHPDGVEHGQVLRLYAKGPEQAGIREFILTPPIADTTNHHPQYQRILDWVLARFKVSRVIVSSLIGHDLYCLSTGLPTMQVLHDFYPAFPLLNADPVEYLDARDRLRLKEALADHRDGFHFRSTSTEYWRVLREAWCKAVSSEKVCLVAPTKHVARRIERLSRGDVSNVEVIPHGFVAPWGSVKPIQARKRQDGKLSLVILGRQSPGKGLNLLKQSLKSLETFARLSLVGAGRNALELFGHRGVDLIIDYKQQELPKILREIGPDAALFLSTVPETWNYTLSEVRSLGIVPVATNLGSFAERISDSDGLVFKPTKEGLVNTVQWLSENRKTLGKLRKAKVTEPSVTQAIKRYSNLLPEGEPKPLKGLPDDVKLSLRSWSLAQSADQRRLLINYGKKIEDLKEELDKRSQWALRQERLARERTIWAKNLNSELNETISLSRKLSTRNEGLEKDLKVRTKWARKMQSLADERTAWAQAVDKDLQKARGDIEDADKRNKALEKELNERAEWAMKMQSLADERTKWAQAIDKDLQKARADIEQVNQRNQDLEKELKERAEWAQSLQALVDERTDWAKRLDADLDSHKNLIENLDRDLNTLREALSERDDRLEQASAELKRVDAERRQFQHLNRLKDAELHNLLQTRTELEQHLAIVLNSKSWRLTRPVRFVTRSIRKMLVHRVWNPLVWPRVGKKVLHSIKTLGWRQSLKQLHHQPLPSAQLPEQKVEIGSEEILEHEMLDDAARLSAEDSSRDSLEGIRVASSENPLVSIVIPVYNKVELTRACLESIAGTATAVPYEVIVVDDCSTDDTGQFLAKCSGLVVLRNEVNSGFIDSCNRGGEQARGEYIVFLNNDTTVTEQWLDKLIEPFQRDPDVGVVGGKLIYPDGRLQEVGGIIFNDASGWNYGRDQEADLPQYSFVSEADYVSGACLAVRRVDFELLGGFDTRFRPAYYEDTDLCFQIRARGKKVIVQPAATIVHHEGATSGTDESGGVKQYQVVNREKFRDKWAEVLADHPPPEADFERKDPIRHVRYRRFKRRMLLIDAVTPQPDHDSGSVRIVAMMTLLKELGYQVSFMAENRLWVDGYSEALQQAGIEVLCAPHVATLEPWLEEHGYDLDLVVVSRHYVLSPMLKMIRHYCPQASLVFDTVDLHFLREEREAELTGSKEMADQAKETREQELALIRACDATLVVSPVEQELLAGLEPDADVRVVSNIHNVHGSRRDWEDRSGLMFVGGFQHPPNVDAVKWLVDEIFPLVRAEIPDVELHLIGSRMPAGILAIDSPGVRVHGFVEELDSFLDGCRVSVAPLRYGAGVKGKVNQAMSHGLPVVATTCAAEGMFLKHDQDVLVADNAEDFARQVVRAHQDRDVWQRLSMGGLANVEKYFSRAAARRALQEIDKLVSAS